MTSKVYRSAQGKSVDLGTIMLKNEHVRAVGNMNVNARGDKLDNNNCVVETKPQQIQKQNTRTTNVSQSPVQTGSKKTTKKPNQRAAAQTQINTHGNSSELDPVTAPQELVSRPPEPTPISQPPAQEIATRAPGVPEGGLAAAMARTREIKQELDRTRRQQQQAQGVRKI